MFRYQDISLEMSNGVGTLTPGIDQAYAYLAQRGISRQDIDDLGLWIVPARDLIQRARGADNAVADHRLAIVFPHVGVDGQPIDWWSARLVDCGLAPVARGFAGWVDQKWGKMFCPPNEPVHAYLVPYLDWRKLQKGDRVYIHESCIKAANGAALGYWSVGLNGVRGWSSRKHGVALVEELRALPWKALELQPVIVFDSNAADNWDVKHAIVSLAAKLLEVTGRHATHILLPPKSDGTHWGFDDFRATLGDDAARDFLDSAGNAPPVEVSAFERLRLELNSRVCVVRALGRIAEQDTGTLMTRGTFCDVNYAHFVVEGEDRQINVPKVWLTDERRTEVEELKYLPGAELMRPGQFLNLWRGMGLEPTQGSVAPWLELLERQVPDEKLRKWIIQWFAYPLQHLGAKLNTYLHLYGPPGTGKGALTYPILPIYGRNGTIIGKDQIGSAFNSVYATRQFVLLDEIHGGAEAGALAISNRIKLLATSPTLTVNKKGEPEYEVDNYVNFVTNSNYSDSIKLDEGDRRACVVQFGTRDTMIPKEWFRDVYFPWADNGGAAALYGYLLGVDLDGFDPKGWAPMTVWKEMVTDATRDAMEKWVRDLWDDPDSVLPPILRGAKVLTPEQVGAAYYPDDPHKNTPGLRNQLGQRMQDLGFKRAEVKVDGTKKRFWLLDRDREWTNEAIREEFQRRKGTAKY